MSGDAALALAAPSDRGPQQNFNLTALGEPVPPSEGESPFPLDFYLSWMSPVFRFSATGRAFGFWSRRGRQTLPPFALVSSRLLLRAKRAEPGAVDKAIQGLRSEYFSFGGENQLFHIVSPHTETTPSNAGYYLVFGLPCWLV